MLALILIIAYLLFFFLKKVYIYKKKKTSARPQCVVSIIWRSQRKKHLFSRHPFATDVPPLLDVSDGPITALYLYRASAAEVYICKQKLEPLGFERAVVSTVYGDVSKISSEFTGGRSC